MMPPDGSSRQVTVGAAGGGAGAGVVEQRVDDGGGGVADHLQVKAVLGERRDGQGSLPAGSAGEPRTGEAGILGMRRQKLAHHSRLLKLRHSSCVF